MDSPLPSIERHHLWSGSDAATTPVTQARFTLAVDAILDASAPVDPSGLGRFVAEARIALGTVAVFCVSTAALMSTWAFLPMVIGWQPSAIISNSMKPSVERGDIVVFQPAEFLSSGAEVDLVEPGAVIRFLPASVGGAEFDPERDTVVHRVVSVDPATASYTTRGDANAQLDSDAVPSTAVVGVGALLVPLVGWPVVWMNEGNVLALAGLFLGAISILWLARGALSIALSRPDVKPFGPIAPSTLAELAARQQTEKLLHDG